MSYSNAARSNEMRPGLAKNQSAVSEIFYLLGKAGVLLG